MSVVSPTLPEALAIDSSLSIGDEAYLACEVAIGDRRERQLFRGRVACLPFTEPELTPPRKDDVRFQSGTNFLLSDVVLMEADGESRRQPNPSIALLRSGNPGFYDVTIFPVLHIEDYRDGLDV